MAVGYTLERVAYRPLRRAPRLAPLITAIGLSIILQHLALIVWSRNIRSPTRRSSRRCLTTSRQRPENGATITNVQIAIIGGSFAMMGRPAAARVPHEARHRHARHRAEPAGRRADGHRHQPRDLAHVRDRRGLGPSPGVMVGSYYGIAHYQMGFLLGLKAFSAAVLGGIGNLAGAMLGGMLLGLIEALGAGYVATHEPVPAGPLRRASRRCAREPRIEPVRLQLSGRVRVHRADPGARVPALGAPGRARRRSRMNGKHAWIACARRPPSA
jgi:branched-chain amino acid transport system permease protein